MIGEQIRELINRNSLESESNTPDYILADYLVVALDQLNRLISAEKNIENKEKYLDAMIDAAQKAIEDRETWYGNQYGEDT